MSDGTLYLGTRRYSSWSLRGWLAVRLADLDVEDNVTPLASDTTSAIAKISPSGLVPYLQHRGLTIWDSLAILEYCAELAPKLWPAERGTRAHARSISCEMHSGFRALRMAMPMNLGREPREIAVNPECLADITRIQAIWADTKSQFGSNGQFLFGAAFTGADIMFAPVVARFIGYLPSLSPESRDYVSAVRQHPLIDRWYRLAAQEPASWRLEKYESLA